MRATIVGRIGSFVILIGLLLGVGLPGTDGPSNPSGDDVRPSAVLTSFDIDGDGVLEYVQDLGNLVNATSSDGYEAYTDPNGNSVLIRYADPDGDGLVDLIIDTNPQPGRVAPNPVRYWDPDDGIVASFVPFDVDRDGRLEHLLDLTGDGVPDWVFESDETSVPSRNTPGRRDGYYAAAEWNLDFNLGNHTWAVDRSLALGLNVMQLYALTNAGAPFPGTTSTQKRWDYYSWFDTVLGNSKASGNFRAFVDYAHSRGMEVFLSSSYATYDPWWYVAHQDGRDMNHEMRRNPTYNSTVQAGRGGTYSMPGAAFVNNSYHISPHDPAFRSWKTALFRNLVENYSVDGFKMDDAYTFANPYWTWESWMTFGDTRNLWHWEITEAYRRQYGVDPSWNDATGWGAANSTTWRDFRRQVWIDFLVGIWRGAGLSEADMVFGYGDVPVGGNAWRPAGSLNMAARMYEPETSYWADTVTGLKRFGVCYRTKPGFEVATAADINRLAPQSWDDSGKWYYWFDSGDPAPGSAKWYAVGLGTMPYWYTLRAATPEERSQFFDPPTVPQPSSVPDADYQNVTLGWQPSTDPAGGALSYEVRVNWTNPFGSGQQTLLTGGTSVSLATANQTVYVWSVRATNGFRTSDWSAEGTFRDLGTTPEPPQEEPANGQPPGDNLPTSVLFLADWIFWMMIGVSAAVVGTTSVAIRRRTRQELPGNLSDAAYTGEDATDAGLPFECTLCSTQVAADDIVCPGCGGVFD